MTSSPFAATAVITFFAPPTLRAPGRTQRRCGRRWTRRVERRPDPSDGRALLVHITEAARRIGRSPHDGRPPVWNCSSPGSPPERCRKVAEEPAALTRLADLAQHRP
ncbi:hypothetical protein [Streptomyces mirabilis]|uniref:hypothetical protein n=1 Tax=Streptomyces mirabilis TaxID=68239 RepID=UPI0033DACCFB